MAGQPVFTSIAYVDFLFSDGKFLGIDWHAWKVVGWLGNAAFFSRFMVQWYASEKQKRVVVPQAFWWLSLVGSFLLLCYALFYRKDSVFIFAYAFTWLPYIRNLVLHRKHKGSEICASCKGLLPKQANFCPNCGVALGSQ